jgi:acetylglutamate kinase
MTNIKSKLRVLKIGGKVLENPSQLSHLLTQFASWQEEKILIHGGGNKASELLEKLGIAPKMYEGRRITDEAALEVATMVYAGWTNKTVVSLLQSFNCNAIGLSGADLNTIQAHKRQVKDIDYGFAGDIDEISVENIQALLRIGATPVFCAITHDKKGQLLNTNADTIAATLAIAMAQIYTVELILCFEKPGVLLNAEDNHSLIPHINKEYYQQLKREGIIFAGMIPKLDNAFKALAKGVDSVVISGIEQLGQGTRLVS